MKTFLEEYGLSILSIVVLLILIAMCTPFGNSTREMIRNVIDSYRNEKTECNVYFYAGDGIFDDYTTLYIAKVEKDKEIGMLPNPTLEGYFFSGWYTSVSGTGEKIEENFVVSEDCKFYAMWNKDPEYIPDEKNNGLYNGKLYRDGKEIGNFDVGTIFTWHGYKWQVLQTKYSQALIISVNVLDSNFAKDSFNDNAATAWNSTTNGKLINGATVYDCYNGSALDNLLDQDSNSFYSGKSYMNSDSSIILTSISAGTDEDENEYSSSLTTVRHVFALSRTEAKYLMDSDASRIGYNNTEPLAWWTRTGQGKYCTMKESTDADGKIVYSCLDDYKTNEAFAVFSDGNFVNMKITDKAGIRPAMWVDLKTIRNIEIE